MAEVVSNSSFFFGKLHNAVNSFMYSSLFLKRRANKTYKQPSTALCDSINEDIFLRSRGQKKERKTISVTFLCSLTRQRLFPWPERSLLSYPSSECPASSSWPLLPLLQLPIQCHQGQRHQTRGHPYNGKENSQVTVNQSHNFHFCYSLCRFCVFNNILLYLFGFVVNHWWRTTLLSF